ncbi:RusA family crossover junction endodeoxyribonuclease [Pseudoglutamicibacter cumminsii]|uniref:RusA family crossover junction endodeoxyribonuclease n=1 Tax=Pseudoglutamicibacter cumminsii TaxID=156979 RepID=UPI00195D7F78|nr:RusA family crossover junction endodeoxyribonuclease [Pseudoglutamicibacter cumminsii]MBM7796871.1 Holliday junction resolvase RusA-like endonuclease [Pseudoglutamicibacter cumminsii]
MPDPTQPPAKRQPPKTLTITHNATPQTQGSMRTYRGRITHTNPRLAGYRDGLTYTARSAAARAGWATRDTPVTVDLTVYLARPKGHTTRAGSRSAAWTAYPARLRTGDLDKHLRATLDALTAAGIWVDDSRVTHITAAKAWADTRSPGVLVVVTDTPPDPVTSPL